MVNPCFLNPRRFFNSYEERNNYTGKVRTEIGLVVQELTAYLCMVRRDLQTCKITLLSHEGNQSTLLQRDQVETSGVFT